MIDVPERERPDRISVLLVIQGVELGVLVGVPLSQDVLVAVVEGLIEVIVECEAERSA